VTLDGEADLVADGAVNVSAMSWDEDAPDSARFRVEVE